MSHARYRRMYVRLGRGEQGGRTYEVVVSLPHEFGRDETLIEVRGEATLSRLLAHLRVAKKSTSFGSDRFFSQAMETTVPITPPQAAREMERLEASGSLLTEEMTTEELRELIEEWRRMEGTARL